MLTALLLWTLTTLFGTFAALPLLHHLTRSR